MLYVSIDVGQLAEQGLDHRLDACAGTLVGHRQSPTLGYQHADQLPSAGDKCDEFTLFFAGQRARLTALRMQDSGKFGQCARIKPVGLGQPAHGTRKIARLTRIDDRHGRTCTGLRYSTCTLVAASGFKDDKCWRLASEPAQ
ncbi:hypothetical protein AWB67_04522 [Caballeronia terrestris]|uniref:Uncharacterized protein n=1 Tax=Caballeronia terrestris TaxID=1226301 RepID=A0A158K0H1_9BURK|nr:hypothetical protein AWB67_04522 [Caballeronia terrestris]